MDSKIYEREIVENTERKFGSSLSYQPAMYVDIEGEKVPLLFTANDIKDAKARAAINPEDIKEGRRSWLVSLFFGDK